MASDNEQKSVLVKQHKRIAQGVKLDGTKMEPQGGNTSPTSKAKGGLSNAKKK
jgi:hypothetical protein